MAAHDLNLRDSARQRRFDELTADSRLAYFERLQSVRPLDPFEMKTVERLFARQADRRARNRANCLDRPAHRRGLA